MRELNILERIIVWILSRLDKRTEEEKEAESNRLKVEMCHKAIQSKVCPHSCNRCAWYTGFNGDKSEHCF